MLAYVFWHWPSSDASVPEYEAAMLDFHRGLAGANAALRGSHTFRVDGEPWLRDGRGYVDWYLLEGGSGALDMLNDLAISAPLREAHDRPALMAAGGLGGLYRLLSGDVAALPAVASWLERPRGGTYMAFAERLRPWAEQPGVTLWRRQMVLGPAREFCLHSPAPLDLPADLQTLTASWTAL
jgi:hypothetical protein